MAKNKRKNFVQESENDDENFSEIDDEKEDLMDSEVGSSHYEEEDDEDEDNEDMLDEEHESGNELEENDEVEKKTIKRPTSFKFISMDTIKDFDLLWAKMAHETLEAKIEKNKTLNERLKSINEHVKSTDYSKIHEIPGGGKSISFTVTNKKNRNERQKEHIEERKSVRRSAGPVMRHLKPMPKRPPTHRKKNTFRT